MNNVSQAPTVMNKNKRSSTMTDNRNKKIKVGGGACFDFNSDKGCSRSSGDSCTDKYNVSHKHVCGHIKDGGEICGAKDHGAHSHV